MQLYNSQKVIKYKFTVRLLPTAQVVWDADFDGWILRVQKSYVFECLVSDKWHSPSWGGGYVTRPKWFKAIYPL